jgi:AhpD family alkylhydroperoxidase
MTITSKEKELAAVGMSVASGCKPCTDYHVKAARKTDASDVEIKQAMNDAFAVRRGATEIMQDYGIAQLGERSSGDGGSISASERLKELVCIGAAFSVNCVSSLKAHVEAAESVGITHEEIATIAKLAAFIKGKAASHVEHLIESLDKPESAYEKEVTACC